MSNENVMKFYQKFATDKELQKKLANENVSKERLVEIAKELGFELTVKDLDEFSKLTINDLEKLFTRETECNCGTCVCVIGGGGNIPGGQCACAFGGGGQGNEGHTCVCVFGGTGQ